MAAIEAGSPGSNNSPLLKRYVVIEFPSKRNKVEVGVVPRNWIVQKGTNLLCRWPLHKTLSEIDSMIINSIPVSASHCKTYDNIKILNQSGSHEKALRIAEALEDESDVSESEGVGSEAAGRLSEPQSVSKRKRQLNRRTEYQYDDDDNASTPPSSRKRRRERPESPQALNYPSAPEIPFQDGNSSGDETQTPYLNTDIENEEPGPSQVLVTGTPIPISVEIADSFETSDILNVKRAEWDDMKAAVAELRTQSRAALVQKAVSDINPEKPDSLPVQTELEMRSLETILANKDDFAYHVSYLHSRALSLDIKPFIWKILTNIFESKFARGVNMNGSYQSRVAEGRGKIALKKDYPRIVNLVEVTVRLKFKTAELKFIHTTVGLWLQDSISRAGGRKQRSLEYDLRKQLHEQQENAAGNTE